jgi:RimJ/RimL family protein N-acetyltransferase
MMLRPTYPIETARLRLRPFSADDLDALYAIQSRVDVTRYLYWDPRSREQVREALVARAQQAAIDGEGDTLVLAIELRDAGTVIGDVNLSWRSAAHMQGEVGFVLHPDYQGRGYGREAASEMLRLGFDGLGLHRIIGRCDARNDASGCAARPISARMNSSRASGATSTCTPCSPRSGRHSPSDHDHPCAGCCPSWAGTGTVAEEPARLPGAFLHAAFCAYFESMG